MTTVFSRDTSLGTPLSSFAVLTLPPPTTRLVQRDGVDARELTLSLAADGMVASGGWATRESRCGPQLAQHAEK